MVIKFGLEFTIAKARETDNHDLLYKLEKIGDIISSNTLDDMLYIPDIIEIFIILTLFKKKETIEHITKKEQVK